MTDRNRLLQIACAATFLAPAMATAAGMAPPALERPGVVHVAYSQTVRDIQAELNARGYDAGPVDGFFGSTTSNAIRAYQRDHNLLTDGQASAALLDHIRRNAAKPAERQDDKRDDGDRRERVIERTQERLATLGYTVRTTGELDWQTRTAISQYQQDNSLAVTGDLDRDLARHIRDKAAGAAPGLSTAKITDIERGLDARGYKVGTVDGRVDDDTKAAIRAYQRDRGDAVTGAVSEDLAEQLSVGLGPSLNTPETIASVQSKLNALGYSAGPADGVMGPSTRTAIRQYRTSKDLGDSSAITEDLVASLEAARPDAEAPAEAEATTQYRELMRDDFEDGDFTQNPNWQVHAGEFQVQRGYLSVKLPAASTQPNASDAQALAGFLRQALGVNVQSPDAVAAIAQGTGIPNAFKIEMTLLGSANQVVQMHVGPYTGRDLTSGYRLVYDQSADHRFALVRRSGGGTEVLAERTGVRSVGDGSRHEIVWTREPNGRMIVSIDGEVTLQVRDNDLTGSFSGLSFVNLAGAWNVHDIAVYAER